MRYQVIPGVSPSWIILKTCLLSKTISWDQSFVNFTKPRFKKNWKSFGRGFQIQELHPKHISGGEAGCKISPAELQAEPVEIHHKREGKSHGEWKSSFQKLCWHCGLSLAFEILPDGPPLHGKGACWQVLCGQVTPVPERFFSMSWLSTVLVLLDCHCLRHLLKAFLLQVLTVHTLQVFWGIMHLQMGFQALCSSLINSNFRTDPTSER